MGHAKPNTAAMTVDGASYTWSYRHPWRVDWEQRLQQISVSVSLTPGRTRELILDLSFAMPGLRPPSETRALQAIEQGIRAAIEAGWDPESRGRSFRHLLVLEG